MKIRHFLLTMVLLAGSNPSLIEASCCTCLPITNKNATINKPGSYALTENITVPIVINSSNVSLDLCTFTVSVKTAAKPAISSNKQNNITIKNGSVTNPNGTGISISNSIGSAVQNVEVFGSNQALSLSKCNECQVNDLNAHDNTSKVSAVVSLSTCNSIQLSNVQANNNTKALTKSAVKGISDNAIIFIGTCSNVTLTDCSANFNKRTVNNTLFAPVEVISSKSVSFINCQANDNSITTQADTIGFTPFLVQQCLDTIINGCQANRNNMAVSTALSMRPIEIDGSNGTIITYTQVNDNKVSSFNVPTSTASQDLSCIAFFSTPKAFPQNDIVISHCQVSGNVVTNGGPGRTQNEGLLNGILIIGDSTSGANFDNRSRIEYCQINGNSITTTDTLQFGAGILIELTNGLTIANCSLDGNNGGGETDGIDIVTCSNIKILNTTTNNTPVIGSASIGIALFIFPGSFNQNIEIIGCQANSNSEGIFIENGKSCSVIDCQTDQNSDTGIFYTSCTDCTLINCSAKENDTGFLMNGDHLLLQGNKAINNASNGFVDGDASTSVYLSNFASGSPAGNNFAITSGTIQQWSLTSSTGQYAPVTGDSSHFSALVNLEQL